jgi:hypothetical protein
MQEKRVKCKQKRKQIERDTKREDKSQQTSGIAEKDKRRGLVWGSTGTVLLWYGGGTVTEGICDCQYLLLSSLS